MVLWKGIKWKTFGLTPTVFYIFVYIYIFIYICIMKVKINCLSIRHNYISLNVLDKHHQKWLICWQHQTNKRSMVCDEHTFDVGEKVCKTFAICCFLKAWPYSVHQNMSISDTNQLKRITRFINGLVKAQSYRLGVYGLHVTFTFGTCHCLIIYNAYFVWYDFAQFTDMETDCATLLAICFSHAISLILTSVLDTTWWRPRQSGWPIISP